MTFERRCFLAFVAIACLVMVLLPVVPGHDIPQHLSYVRLIVSGGPTDLFSAPDLGNVYATTYRILAPLARSTSPEHALRIALVAYVVGLSFAVRHLVESTWRGPAITSLAGPIVAFNPMLCMGLLPWVFALPAFVGTVAFAVSFVDRRRTRDLAFAFVLAAVTAALHGFAAAMLVVFLGCFLVVRRDRGSFFALLAAALGAGIVQKALGSVAPFPRSLFAALVDNVRVYGLVEGTIGTFRISFSHWLLKVEDVVGVVVGPFPTRLRIACGVLLLGAAATLVRAKEPGVRGVRRALALFGIASLLAPAAIQVPDDLSLIDFRLIGLAAILGLAAVPPRTRRVEVFVVAAAALLLVWTRQLRGAAGEVMEMVHLVDRLGVGDRVLALPMHDGSAYFETDNALLHYSAVHHTARNGGLTSLFWGKFSRRLPIGYLPGKEPPHPHDWAPWELEESQLPSYTHVLVRWPTSEDEERMQELATRVRQLRDTGRLRTIACDGDCCLFATN